MRGKYFVMSKQPNKDNLGLWNRHDVTDPSYTKKVTFGRNYTAIDPQYQIYNATVEWGPYGSAWGIKDINYGIISNVEGVPYVQTIEAIFYYPDGEFPISSDIMFFEGKDKNIVKDQRKKLLTDITTKALSKLGFNADIFLGFFDDSKYVQSVKQDTTINTKVFNKANLKEYKESIRAMLKNHDKPEDVTKKILEKYERIEKKTEAILVTLTVDNLDEEIRKIV